MGTMIASAQFDIIFVQYYNTPQCSARTWVAANPDYLSTGIERPSGFSYKTWSKFLVGSASANAKLYIGVTGGPSENDYIPSNELSKLVKAYFCDPNFGGVMIWEATLAENNLAGIYYTSAKNILIGYSKDPSLSCNGIALTSKLSSTSTTKSTTQLSSKSSTPGTSTKSSSTSKLSSSTKQTTTPKSSTSLKSSTSSQPVSASKVTTLTTQRKSPTSSSSSSSKLTSTKKVTTTSKTSTATKLSTTEVSQLKYSKTKLLRC
jgi:chitinase